MSDETPFKAALPGLQAHALAGEDITVLLNHPTSHVVQWVRRSAVATITCAAVGCAAVGLNRA